MASTSVCRTLTRSLATTSFTRCSRPQYLRLRAQQALSRPSAYRGFAISAKGQLKRYTEDHEWVELSEDGATGTIGISEYAAKALGDVVYVELPTADLEVSQGESIGAVESVKSASDIMTPISGTILEANQALEDTPSTINKSPEGDGWLAKISVANKAELENLMDGEGYKKFTEEAEAK